MLPADDQVERSFCWPRSSLLLLTADASNCYSPGLRTIPAARRPALKRRPMWRPPEPARPIRRTDNCSPPSSTASAANPTPSSTARPENRRTPPCARSYTGHPPGPRPGAHRTRLVVSPLPDHRADCLGHIQLARPARTPEQQGMADPGIASVTSSGSAVARLRSGGMLHCAPLP